MLEKPHEVGLCPLLAQRHCVFLLWVARPSGPMLQGAPDPPTWGPSCDVESIVSLACPSASRPRSMIHDRSPLWLIPGGACWPSASPSSPAAMRTARMRTAGVVPPCANAAWIGGLWSRRTMWPGLPPWLVWSPVSTAKTSLGSPRPAWTTAAPVTLRPPPPLSSIWPPPMLPPLGSRSLPSIDFPKMFRAPLGRLGAERFTGARHQHRDLTGRLR